MDKWCTVCQKAKDASLVECPVCESTLVEVPVQAPVQAEVHQAPPEKNHKKGGKK
jgi:hypothetical protein